MTRQIIIQTLAVATAVLTETASGFYLQTNSATRRFQSRPVRKNNIAHPLASTTKLGYKNLNTHEEVNLEKFLAQQEKETIVLNCPLFPNLDKGNLARVVAVMEEVHVSQDEIIIRQGDSADDGMYFVKQGDFLCYDEVTNQAFKSCHQRGDYFGELALLYGDLGRAASVKATSRDAVLYRITKEDFELSVDKNQLVSEGIVETDTSYEAFFENRRRHQALSKCPLFRKMTSDDQQRIVQLLKPIQVQAGEQIINQGDAQADSMYFVAKGTFECFDKKSGEVLATCRENDHFGELALVLDTTRRASVRAAADEEATYSLYKLDKSDFMEALQECSYFDQTIELLQEKYGIKNPWALLGKLNPAQLYDLAVAKSRPHKAPVSFHSTLATTSMGLFLVYLIQTFSPGWHTSEFFDSVGVTIPRLFDASLFTAGDWHIRITSFLFAIVGSTGVLRLPPNTPKIRKLFFETTAAQTVLSWMLADSNLSLVGDSTFDLMTGPFHYIVWALIAFNVFLSGELIVESIAGPEKGRQTVPFEGNRFTFTIFAAILPIIGIMYNLPPVFLAQDMDTFHNLFVPFAEQAGGMISGYNMLTEAYMGLGMLIATLLFEQKITQKQANLFLGANLFFTGYFDGTIDNAFAPVSLWAENAAYSQEIYTNLHFAELVFGSAGLCALFGAGKLLLSTIQKKGEKQ